MTIIKPLLIAALILSSANLPIQAEPQGRDRHDRRDRREGREARGQRDWAPNQGPRSYRGRDFGRDFDRRESPRVDRRGWRGHSYRRDDDRFRIQGRYNTYRGGFGPRFRWHISGGGPNAFWFNNWRWSVAPWEYNLVDSWYWDRDQIIIYADPDHPGWYLAYNPRLGSYVHVRFLG